jgi:hypothetical protein
LGLMAAQDGRISSRISRIQVPQPRRVVTGSWDDGGFSKLKRPRQTTNRTDNIVPIAVG